MEEAGRTRLARIADLETTVAAHYRLFLKTYPYPAGSEVSTDEPQELWQLAIRAQALLASLGPKAVSRFNRLGFSLLFGYDNAADRYAWALAIVENRVGRGMFCSIALRIDAELERLKVLTEIGCSEAYDGLDDESFIVSADRYQPLFQKDSPARTAGKPDAPELAPQPEQRVLALKLTLADERKAYDALDRVQKHTSIWSNVSSIAKAVLGI